MVAVSTLAKVAVVGALVTATTGVWLHSEVESRIKKAPYFTHALKVLRGHPEALRLLGEPMKVGRIDLGDTDNNRCDATSATFKVNVKGPRDKGTLYLRAHRDADTGTPWVISRLALRVDSVDGAELPLLNSQTPCC